MKRLIFLFLVSFLLLSGCELPGKKPPVGVLEGRASVGPLSPVQQEGVAEPPPPPQVFTTRGLAIYRADGKTLVKQLAFNADGTYRVELPVGTYVVGLDPKNGMEYAPGLPAQVTIKANESTRLDVEIDTGVR